MSMTVVVDYGPFSEEEGFLALEGFTGGESYPFRIFGVVPGGFLVGKEQVKKFTSLHYSVELLPWTEIERVHIRRVYSKLRFLGGGALAAFGTFAIYMAATNSGGETFRAISLGLTLLLVGVVLLLGFVCSRIDVLAKPTKDGVIEKFKWISPPLCYRKTLAHCAVALRYAKAAGVPVTSHIDDDGAEFPESPPPSSN